MAQNGKREILGIHSATVVLDQDEIGTACGCRNIDAGGAGIERVLDQLLDRTRGPLDHLARGDSVDRALGETTDTRTRVGKRPWGMLSLRRLSHHARKLADTVIIGPAIRFRGISTPL